MEKRGNHFKVWGLIVVAAIAVALALAGFALLSIPERADDGFAPGEFSHDELVRFASPAIYTLTRRVEGTVTIPALQIDLDRFSVSPAPRGRPLKLPFDVEITRAGFAIHTHGYIIADGSLSASSTWKRKAVESFVQVSIEKELARLGPGGSARLERDHDPEEAYTFGAHLLNVAVSQSSFEIARDSLSARPTIEEVKLSEPFSARFVEPESQSVSQMALVALNNTGIPALRLSRERPLRDGTEIFIPRMSEHVSSTGRFNNEKLLSGRIAMATTSGAGIPVFPIADISPSDILPGVSAIDRRGMVLGMVSVLSPRTASSSGMLALVPGTAIAEFLSLRSISNDEGLFSERVRAGMLLLRDRRCARALEAFREARAAVSDPVFGAHLKLSVAECERMIESGNSINSSWDEFFERLGPDGRVRGLFVAAGAAFAVFLIASLMVVARSLHFRRREERSGLDDSPFAS